MYVDIIVTRKQRTSEHLILKNIKQIFEIFEINLSASIEYIHHHKVT